MAWAAMRVLDPGASCMAWVPATWLGSAGAPEVRLARHRRDQMDLYRRGKNPLALQHRPVRCKLESKVHYLGFGTVVEVRWRRRQDAEMNDRDGSHVGMGATALCGH